MNNAIRLFSILSLLVGVVTSAMTAADITSAGSGNWNATATWAGGVVPGPADNVTIRAGDTVTVNVANAVCNDLTANGYLYFDITNTGYSLTVNGNATVGAAGRLRSGGGTPSAFRSHDLILHKNLTVTSGGNFDMRVGSNPNVSIGRVIFTGNTNSTINLSQTVYGSSVEEFNSVIINKSGGAKVILASGNLFHSNNSTTAPDTLLLNSGVIETGTNHWVHLRTGSQGIVGASPASYVRGILGKGASNSGGTSTIEYPLGDATNYRPVTLRITAPSNATGHYVWATLRSGNANTGSSTFANGIDRVSAVRYFEVGYLKNAGTADSMRFYGFGPSYGTDDGVGAGNVDLRVAYSKDTRATWRGTGPTAHTTTPATLPTTISGDSLAAPVSIYTGTSFFVSLARATGTTTNTLGVGTWVVEEAGIPQRYFVAQNYPNPFNPSTTIEYGLPKEGNVTVRVFNLVGQDVATLVDGKQIAGVHRVQFDASNLTSGIYFYRVAVDGFAQTNRMVLMK